MLIDFYKLRKANLKETYLEPLIWKSEHSRLTKTFQYSEKERKMSCTGQKAIMVSDSLTTVETGPGELKSLTC